MKATITVTRFDGRTVWHAQKLCLTEAEAKDAEARLDAMPAPEAYIHHAHIADADGFPVTGASNATHVTEPVQ